MSSVSENHPYWAYGPDHGTPMIDALAEGRRATALQKAIEASFHQETGEEILHRAAKFEAFLKGEPVEDANGAPLDGRS